jgi:GNAT superfamily N-acetyltransferase
MTTTIKCYKADDASVWPAIGPFLTSRAVAKDLGMQPFSDGAIAWWVATQDGKTVGFCALMERRGERWIDNSFVVPDARGKGIHKKLCEARDGYLKELPELPLNMCCKADRWKHYKAQGFKEQRRRGEWVYGAKGAAAKK